MPNMQDQRWPPLPYDSGDGAESSSTYRLAGSNLEHADQPTAFLSCEKSGLMSEMYSKRTKLWFLGTLTLFVLGMALVIAVRF